MFTYTRIISISQTIYVNTTNSSNSIEVICSLPIATNPGVCASVCVHACVCACVCACMCVGVEERKRVGGEKQMHSTALDLFCVFVRVRVCKRVRKRTREMERASLCVCECACVRVCVYIRV